jgi:hypothetical protein
LAINSAFISGGVACNSACIVLRISIISSILIQLIYSVQSS